MDHVNFVLLLLIVSVTTMTFGSMINAKNPSGEEQQELRSDPDSSSYRPKKSHNLEEIEALLSDAGLDRYPKMVPNRQELHALLKRSHHAEAKLQGQKSFRDQPSKMYKRVAAGTIIESVGLTLNLLTTLLDTLANVDRKVAIGIDNHNTYTWQGPYVYFRSGTADENLPYSVPNGKAVLYGPRKTDGPVATGAVGVLTYYIPSIHKTLAVMWSIPFDYNLYQNWWNANLYHGNIQPSQGIYENLYYDANPFKANGWHHRDLGSGLTFRGSMSSSGKATLEIHVFKK